MLIEIYTRADCPGCQKVKQILKNHQYPFTEWEIGRNITREEVKRRFPDIKVVPIIMVDNEQKTVGELQLLTEWNADTQ